MPNIQYQKGCIRSFFDLWHLNFTEHWGFVIWHSDADLRGKLPYLHLEATWNSKNLWLGLSKPFVLGTSIGFNPRRKPHLDQLEPFLIGLLNRLDYLNISRAAAQISGDPPFDLFNGRIRLLSQKGRGGHQHARCTVAALNGAMFYEALLQWMKGLGRSQSFDRLDLLGFGLKG